MHQLAVNIAFHLLKFRPGLPPEHAPAAATGASLPEQGFKIHPSLGSDREKRQGVLIEISRVHSTSTGDHSARKNQESYG
jgi:hypothetical protein